MLYCDRVTAHAWNSKKQGQEAFKDILNSLHNRPNNRSWLRPRQRNEGRWSPQSYPRLCLPVWLLLRQTLDELLKRTLTEGYGNGRILLLKLWKKIKTEMKTGAKTGARGGRSEGGRWETTRERSENWKQAWREVMWRAQIVKKKSMHRVKYLDINWPWQLVMAFMDVWRRLDVVAPCLLKSCSKYWLLVLFLCLSSPYQGRQGLPVQVHTNTIITDDFCHVM